MKDNDLFLAIIKEFGLIDLDVHFIGVDHLVSTQVGTLDVPWFGKKTFADLTRIKNKLSWLQKGKDSALRNKEGTHLFLLMNDLHRPHYDYIFAHAKALYFFDKPYCLVVFQGDPQGIPLIYRMKTEETSFERLSFLNRTLINDF